ncbi:MAG TPA: 3'-5' exonuclease [Pirellulales bacterium]|jgi:DNA polymerase-3 subunit epsilon|nr:3'-5' exonuclease [Pirellulales bacterium]
MPPGLLGRRVADTPIAVIDLATTGLSPGQDRVVELSVVRVDPGQPPRHVLDSLVKPNRKVTGTEIHGLTDADVADAPTFADLAPDLLMATSGCVVAGYNVGADMRFLGHELGQLGILETPPHLCLMYMQPLLGLGERCALSVACQRLGIPFSATNHASGDSWAAAQLLQHYFARMHEQGIATFGDLRERKPYKFLDSLLNVPPEYSLATGRCSPKRRTMKPQRPGDQRPSPKGYWEALAVAVSDLQITDREVAELTEMRRTLQLSDDCMRMLHAKLFAAVLRQFIDDELLDAAEARKLKTLAECLRRLGWAPGD